MKRIAVVCFFLWIATDAIAQYGIRRRSNQRWRSSWSCNYRQNYYQSFFVWKWVIVGWDYCGYPVYGWRRVLVR